MTIVKCLCCEKEMDIDEQGCLSGGGFMEVSFGFGSRNDQVGGGNDPLLDVSDEIEAYICDDCFDKRRNLMRGFRVRTEKQKTEINGD